MPQSQKDLANGEEPKAFQLEASSQKLLAVEHKKFSEGLKTMRHQKATKKLGRNTSHRRALLRNLVTSLMIEERIETTPAKAKAMRPHVEKMTPRGKRGDGAAPRRPGAYLMTREPADRFFDEIAPCRGDHTGGNL